MTRQNLDDRHGARVGRVPVVEADLARLEQDTDTEAGQQPTWEHGGHSFRVLSVEPVRSSKGVFYLNVIPLDEGPNPNWRQRV